MAASESERTLPKEEMGSESDLPAKLNEDKSPHPGLSLFTTLTNFDVENAPFSGIQL